MKYVAKSSTEEITHVVVKSMNSELNIMHLNVSSELFLIK